MVVDFILNMFLVIILVSLFNLVRYILKIRKIMKMHKDNPNIQGISIINGEIKVIEKEGHGGTAKEKVAEEFVQDPICGASLEKKEAYRILKDGKEHFFCSWECREKFLKEHRVEEGEI
ncbi:YHS domain-containing protein [Cellulosilyticum sp. I15G10I2]|uniref:YHS domain-containing protein n=1 Tax=Cellulosilyticum sp. I15G10I2 TaxID=1892843 RepID=UPI00085C177A|nr:YHS domain-containing protein [Cellulosilyticum sp. I15G10I2]